MKLKQILNEGGIRNIKALAKRYKKAAIYFHQDLDGVTTAIAMKAYLEDNGIKVVEAHIIQYGDKEFSVKKTDANGDTMPVLVDFAHGKPMFVIHTDHHDRQAGAGDTKSTSFRASRSNVETISQRVSPKELFPQADITLINTVDSADFAKYDLTPKQIANYIFDLDKSQSLDRNKMKLGLVVNKLLLAFKNKNGFLEQLVLESNPSLLSILGTIKKWIKKNISSTTKGFQGSKGFKDITKTMQGNADDYAEKMKSYAGQTVENGIIYQYGGGSMIKPGSFDRYTPFRNNPDADFLIMAWPLGLVQASCNPFKKTRELKGVNLGDIAQEVLGKWESELKKRVVKISTIKYIAERSKEFTESSVGFTFKDFKALYADDKIKVNTFNSKMTKTQLLNKVESLMSKPFKGLTDDEKKFLSRISVSEWDLIQANSGGHKCITNISGLSFIDKAVGVKDIAEELKAVLTAKVEASKK